MSANGSVTAAPTISRTATEVQRNAGQPHHHPPAPVIGGINEHVHSERLTYPCTPAAIEVARPTKTYGEVEAVCGVSFTVAHDEVFRLLGPNGTGMSTTVNVLSALALPTSGTARASGFDVPRERYDVRRRIGPVGLKASVGAELAAAQSGTVAATAGECDAPLIATVVMPTGGWL